MDVNSRIEEQLKSHDILLYMKGTPDFPQCGFSGQTIAALNAVGKPFATVNILEDEEIRQGLKAKLTILSVAELLGEATRRINRDESVSRLFLEKH